jgi:C-terminal processing protease CtpA/Prc
VAGDGTYTLTLPDNPAGQPFDVTTGGAAKTQSGLLIFDVRLMSDVGERGYMVPNEDNIASSLNISIEFKAEGGTLIAWTADDKEQFPNDSGPDGKLFTADDPQMTLPAGWSLIDLDSKPFKVIRESAPRVNLITTGLGDTINYTSLSCDVLIPTFLDRAQKLYPFTDLHKVDWTALRDKLIPASKAAQTRQDCEKIIRDFGNAIPDGHVDYYLPTLRDEVAGSLGLVLTPLTDGRIGVSVLRPNGPAERAGIKVGAILTAWDGKPMTEALKSIVLQYANSSTPHGLLSLQLANLTRGPMGSTVEVTYQNPDGTTASATLTRDEPQAINGMAPPTLQDNKLASGIGYIRIPRFEDIRTQHAFDEAVTSLIDQKVNGIIIDVRSNPGGFSQMADAMASRFFDKSFLTGRMVASDGRLVYQTQIDPRQPVYTGPLAILVDVDTSSSGDFFAYAFKSTHRAQIVGNTPSSGMAGTVSGGQYYLPGGAFIQVPTGAALDDNNQIEIEGQGVAPDILVLVTVESLVSGEDTVLKAAEAALLAAQK